jgi:hypothetical protein
MHLDSRQNLRMTSLEQSPYNSNSSRLGKQSSGFYPSDLHSRLTVKANFWIELHLDQSTKSLINIRKLILQDKKLISSKLLNLFIVEADSSGWKSTFFKCETFRVPHGKDESPPIVREKLEFNSNSRKDGIRPRNFDTSTRCTSSKRDSSPMITENDST